MRDQVLALLKQEKLVVILRGVPQDCIGKVAQAMVDGGIRLLEVTFDQRSSDPGTEYQKQIEGIRNAVGDQLMIGAGTVLSAGQVDAAAKAGAQYIISPAVKKDVIGRTRELGLVSIPGAMTPSEIVAAHEYGADIVKLFPADDLGYHYIKNIKAPLSHITLMATGGVTPETIPPFFEAGVSCCATGISIVQKRLLAEKDFAGMTKLAQEHIRAVRSCNLI